MQPFFLGQQWLSVGFRQTILHLVLLSQRALGCTAHSHPLIPILLDSSNRGLGFFFLFIFIFLRGMISSRWDYFEMQNPRFSSVSRQGKTNCFLEGDEPSQLSVQLWNGAPKHWISTFDSIRRRMRLYRHLCFLPVSKFWFFPSNWNSQSHLFPRLKWVVE